MLYHAHWIAGLAIYNDADALKRDAYIYEGPSMDECLGHACKS